MFERAMIVPLQKKKKESWLNKHILGLLLAWAVLPDDELDKEVGL